ncbi:hypothetical protein FVE85_0459 [Porphyridium purpureum]|uniref:Uncharacterized protein n=1 Tax=Porphyridium purpureum TaxID=35688 RepID=A0A5J4Z0D2_PORPP|nr:hypothetical protein FVE85_0459 [Porphyridium purpureum]|eukprot:POR5666..scf208_2
MEGWPTAFVAGAASACGWRARAAQQQRCTGGVYVVRVCARSHNQGRSRHDKTGAGNGARTIASRPWNGSKRVLRCARVVMSSRKFAKPRGYWTDIKNILAELDVYVQERGLGRRMPTMKELRQNHRADLAGAIRRHGGLQVVAEQAELTMTSILHPRSLYLTYAVQLKRGRMKPHNFWRSFENLRREIEAFVREQHPSMEALDEPSLCAEREQWNLPTARELELANRSDLIRAIQKHGGMDAVAKKLNLRTRYKKKGYWTDFNTVAEHVTLLCDEYELGNAMPTMSMVASLGPPGLHKAIRMHGGRHTVAQQLGRETFRARKGYWADRAAVVRELKQFVSEHATLLSVEEVGSGGAGHDSTRFARRVRMPTRAELVSAGRGDLAQALVRHDSMQTFADELELVVTPRTRVSCMSRSSADKSSCPRTPRAGLIDFELLTNGQNEEELDEVPSISLWPCAVPNSRVQTSVLKAGLGDTPICSQLTTSTCRPTHCSRRPHCTSSNSSHVHLSVSIQTRAIYYGFFCVPLACGALVLRWQWRIGL